MPTARARLPAYRRAGRVGLRFSCWIVEGIVGFFAASLSDLLRAGAQRLVVRLDRERETDIGRVYSWPQKIRVSPGRSRNLASERHIISGLPSIDPPAADGEHRVADEGELVGGKPIGDMPQCVSRRLQHMRRQLPTLTVSPSPTVSSTAGFSRPRRAAQPPGNHTLLQCRDAAGVIAMMMGYENIGELPAVPFSAASTGAASGHRSPRSPRSMGRGGGRQYCPANRGTNGAGPRRGPPWR